MTPRIVVRVDLTPAAKKQIDQLTSEFGMTQVSMLSRLIERFAKMPRGAQAAMLGLLPQDFEPEIVQMILRHLRERNAD